MSFLIPRDYATIILNSATVISMISIMIMTAEALKRGRDDDKYFFGLLVLTIIASVSEAVGYLFEEKSLPCSRALSTAGMTILFLSYILIGIVWDHYCRIRFKYRGISAERITRPAYIPGAVMLLVILLNVFTGWIFSYDENAFYHRGPLYVLIYIVLFAYVTEGFVHLVRYRNKRSSRMPIPVWVYLLPLTAAFIFTFAIPGSASFGPTGIALCIAYTHTGTTIEVLEINYNKH